MKFMFEKFNQSQMLTLYLLVASIHAEQIQKQAERIENTGDACTHTHTHTHTHTDTHTHSLCADLLTARYLPSLSALQHTHTLEHFHSFAFIHSITGSQRAARANEEKTRDGESRECYYKHQKHTPLSVSCMVFYLNNTCCWMLLLHITQHLLTPNYQKATQ